MNFSTASQSRYLNLFSDKAFRRVFGSERDKALTLSFLNTLLESHEQIADYQLVSTVYVSDNPADRGIVLDLQCLTQDGRRIVVELQKRRQTYFRERTLFYATWPIQAQGKPTECEIPHKRQWDYNYKAVYVISLLDFVLDKQSTDTRIVSRKMIRDVETNETWTDRLVFVNVELSRFRKKLNECITFQDKWFYVLKNLHRLMEQPHELKENVFNHLFKITDKTRFDTETLVTFEESEQEYNHMKNALDYAIRDGLQQGRELGLEQGRELGLEQGRELGLELGLLKEKIEITQNMLNQKFPWETIEAITHVSESNFDALKQRYHELSTPRESNPTRNVSSP